MGVAEPWSAVQVYAQRLRDLRNAREQLEDGPREDQVLGRAWEPHRVYVLQFQDEHVFKVGLTRDVKRPDLLRRGRGVVRDEFELANKFAAFVVESHVWLLTNEARCAPPDWAYGSGKTEYWRDSIVVGAIEELAAELVDDRDRPAWGLWIYAPSPSVVRDSGRPAI